MDVFWDNLQVTHSRGAILEESSYYPFGLLMAGISSRAANKIEANKRFQGQEFAHREFGDGSGLEMYEFKYRMDDPQTGRFWQIDPLAEDYVYNSTYAFSENKVTSHIELEGLESVPFNSKDYTNNGESTQIKKPIVCYNCTVVQSNPAFTFTVSKGNQVGIKIGNFGGEANFGSKEIFKVTDADPGTNQADKVSTKKGLGIQVGIVNASKEITSKSEEVPGMFGLKNEKITSEVTSNLSFGIKKTPLSAGVERTWTVEQYAPSYQENITSDSRLQPYLGASKSPGASGTNKKGLEFSGSLYYKVELKVDVKQMLLNIFKEFNTGH